MLTIRCSKLGLSLACPASMQAPEVATESDDAPARLGNAFHAWAADFVRNTLRDSWHSYADEWQVDRDELRLLMTLGGKCWEQLAPHFEDLSVEQPGKRTAPEITLTGTRDVIGFGADKTRALIVDWKSGWLESDWEDQLRGYAWLTLTELPDVQEVWAAVVMVRRQEIIPNVWTRQELTDWWIGLPARLRDKDTYRPGSHCQYCPRAMSCPARAEQLQQAAMVLVGADANPLEPLTPETLVKLTVNARQLAKICESVAEAVKTEVKLRGNVEGLKLIERQKREIDAREAFPILAMRLGTDKVLAATRISKGKIEEEIKAQSPPRKGAANIREVMAELEGAGAIRLNIEERLEVTKETKAIPAQPTEETA